MHDNHLSLMAGSTPTPAELEVLAIQSVVRAAVVIRRGAIDPSAIGTKTSQTDVVTQTDLDSEQTVIELLRAATPEAGFIGEESPADSRAARLQWVIDPLDGTVNFLYRVPLFAISVAAAIEGVFVAGAVLDVPRGEIFAAHKGGGARCGQVGAEITLRSVSADDLRPMVSSSCHELSACLLATGFSYDSGLRLQQGHTVSTILGSVRDIRCFGSAALQLCWVADGRIDAYFERDIKIWDWAAASIIATEAGVHLELPCPENNDLVFGAAPGIARSLRPLLHTK